MGEDQGVARPVGGVEPVYLFEVDSSEPGVEDGERRRMYVLAANERAALHELIRRGEGNPKFIRVDRWHDREDGVRVIEQGNIGWNPLSGGVVQPVDPGMSALLRRPVRTIAYGVFMGLLMWALFVLVVAFFVSAVISGP